MKKKAAAVRGKAVRLQYCERLIPLVLFLAIITLYWQVRHHEFISYDDPTYIIENQGISSGLTAETIAWAFTTSHAGNWHPLTWISHALDIQLYGMAPGPHHLTNVAIHAFSTILLFLLLMRITGGFWQSVLVAALFGLHPLRVESVAWAAERKDVLATFFWIVTMWMYVRYMERSSRARYSLLIASFALGLMAKPILVTLPFVLLLLDFWPLRRIDISQASDDAGKKSVFASDWQRNKAAIYRLLWEKVPLLIMAGFSSVITFYVQRSAGAVTAIDSLPLGFRIENAFLSYVRYIGKMFWPLDLAFFYPYPRRFLSWQIISAALLLIAISILVVVARRRRPCLAFGWFWYILTLVPVIGFVQVGIQAMADRYTYIPHIGLAIMLAWGVAELGRGRRFGSYLVTAAACVFVCFISLCTWKQVGFWKDDVTLFRHALEATENNFVAHNDLGRALEKEQRVEDAIAQYREALSIKPDFVLALNNLAAALGKQGDLDEAIVHLSEALRLRPDYADAHNNFGIALSLKGKKDEAIRHFSEALRIQPDHANAAHNLKVARFSIGPDAIAAGRYPEFPLPTLEGTKISPAEYRGKVVILNFWATWCGPCRKEIPEFTEFYKNYSDKGVQVLGVAVDEGGIDVVKPFAHKIGINYPVLIGGPAVRVAYALDKIPVTIILDREGTMASRYVGSLNYAVLEKAVKQLLN